jgi:hypothetical protein
MARSPAQKRYAEKHAAELREKNLAYKALPAVKRARTERDAEQRNQRNSLLGWRWLAWSSRRKATGFEKGSLSFVDAGGLDDPHFVFSYQGTRRVERLREELPKWRGMFPAGRKAVQSPGSVDPRGVQI